MTLDVARMQNNNKQTKRQLDHIQLTQCVADCAVNKYSIRDDSISHSLGLAEVILYRKRGKKHNEGKGKGWKTTSGKGYGMIIFPINYVW